MTQREMLELCASSKLEVSLTLRSGASFRGTMNAVRSGQAGLDLPGSDRVWVLLEEIAAVTLHGTLPPLLETPVTEEDFLRQALTVEERLPIELVWSGAEPTPSELQAAWETYLMVVQSLREFSISEENRDAVEQKIRTLRLVTSDFSRILYAGGVLEVGFELDFPPTPAAELTGLLASIL